MTTNEEIIAATAGHIRARLADDSAHDWWHIQRVWQMALAIGRREQADLFVVQLAALLHDIADWKFHAGDEAVGPALASAWLKEMHVVESVIAHVCEIIRDLSFKGAGVATPMRTIEGQVVQDADRLDAIGAIGIARAFAYGGHAGRAIFDPEVPAEPHATFAAYKKNSGPTINHFHEKLLLLKDRMNTATARGLAAERHRCMEEFLTQFDDEWHGRK